MKFISLKLIFKLTYVTSMSTQTNNYQMFNFFHSTTTRTTPPLNLGVLKLRYNLRDVITKSLLFIEAQRSGALPDSNRISWRSHSALSDGSDEGLDLSGGYYIGEIVLFVTFRPILTPEYSEVVFFKTCLLLMYKKNLNKKI